MTPPFNLQNQYSPDGILLGQYWGEHKPEMEIAPPEIESEDMQQAFIILYQTGLEDFIYGEL